MQCLTVSLFSEYRFSVSHYIKFLKCYYIFLLLLTYPGTTVMWPLPLGSWNFSKVLTAGALVTTRLSWGYNNVGTLACFTTCPQSSFLLSKSLNSSISKRFKFFITSLKPSCSAWTNHLRNLPLQSVSWQSFPHAPTFQMPWTTCYPECYGILIFVSHHWISFFKFLLHLWSTFLLTIFLSNTFRQ